MSTVEKLVMSLDVDDESPDSHARGVARALVRGRLEGIDATGAVLVSYSGREPEVASFMVGLSHSAWLRAIEKKASVLLEFIDGDPHQPVIMGLIQSRIETYDNRMSSAEELDVELTAGRTMMLRCGASSIELHEDGRVVLRGTNLRSVSSGGNVIQGAYVDIN